MAAVTLSYSAPQMTDEDESTERDLILTDEEKKEVMDIATGKKRFLQEETSALLETAHEHLAEELFEIPESRKRDYIQALSECPELVETESSSIRFLRAANYDAKRAAFLLTEYWMMRKKIFKEKAFLPMTLAGAMSDPLDHEIIQVCAGVAFMLPEDRFGRTPLYFNRGLYNHKKYGRFGMERESSQTNGFVNVVATSAYDGPGCFDRIQSKMMFQSLSAALPMNVVFVHMYEHLEFAIKLVTPSVRFLVHPQMRVRTKKVRGSTFEFLKTVQEHGLEPKNLPSTVGGTFSLDGKAFYEHRQRVEAGLRG